MINYSEGTIHLNFLTKLATIDSILENIKLWRTWRILFLVGGSCFSFRRLSFLAQWQVFLFKPLEGKDYVEREWSWMLSKTKSRRFFKEETTIGNCGNVKAFVQERLRESAISNKKVNLSNWNTKPDWLLGQYEFNKEVETTTLPPALTQVS